MSRPRVLLGASGCWSWGDQRDAGGSGVARVLEAETGVRGSDAARRPGQRGGRCPSLPCSGGIPGLSPALTAVGRVCRATGACSPILGHPSWTEPGVP